MRTRSGDRPSTLLFDRPAQGIDYSQVTQARRSTLAHWGWPSAPDAESPEPAPRKLRAVDWDKEEKRAKSHAKAKPKSGGTRNARASAEFEGRAGGKSRSSRVSAVYFLQDLPRLAKRGQSCRRDFMSSTIEGHARVNLERLLRSCDALATGGLSTRTERRRFETYLNTLQGCGTSWRARADRQPRSCSEAQLGEYRRRIERLAELLDADKLLSGAGSALALTQALCNGIDA